ncbi:hypothetical protein ACFLZH_04590 [Patescibacteria group bacterium]
MNDRTIKSEALEAETSSEELLNLMLLPPKEMAEHFRALEEKGELKEFLKKALQDETFKAYLSYYQKWFEVYVSEENRGLVDDIINTQREEVEDVVDELPLGLEKKYTPEELFIIFSNLIAIQFTFGCQQSCDWCGLDAVKKTRDYIPFHQSENLLEQHGETIQYAQKLIHHALTPYFASDIRDYRPPKSGKKPQDILALLFKHIGKKNVHITSRGMSTKFMAEYVQGTSGPRISTLGLNEDQKEKRKLQIQSMGFKDAHYGIETPRKLGLNLIRGSKVKGIQIQSGIILTPRGLYNSLPTDYASQQAPQGHIIVPFKGFEVPEDKKEIEKGNNINEYLFHGIVLKKFKNPIIDRGITLDKPKYGDKETNYALILYNNSIYYVRYTDEGVIEDVNKYQLDEYEMRDKEDITIYANRLAVMHKVAKSKKEKDEVLQKTSKAVLAELMNGNIGFKKQDEFSRGFSGMLWNLDLNFIQSWPDDKVRELLEKINPIGSGKINCISHAAIFSTIIIYRLMEIHPELVKEFIMKDQENFWRYTFHMHYNSQMMRDILVWAIENNCVFTKTALSGLEYFKDLGLLDADEHDRLEELVS